MTVRFVSLIRYSVPLLASIAGISGIFFISRWVGDNSLPRLSIFHITELNIIFAKQLYMLPLTAIILGILYFYDRNNFVEFFRLGNLTAPAKPIHWLGISERRTWHWVGRYLAIIITSGTLVFLIIGLISSHAVHLNDTYLKHLPLAILFATTNAWSEEIFARVTIVMGLSGKAKPAVLYLTSAMIFGIPHYYGVPGGPVGMVMAGFLGWLLAKSMFETKGIFWPWFIHAVQDVVIFSALLMMITKDA